MASCALRDASTGIESLARSTQLPLILAQLSELLFCFDSRPMPPTVEWAKGNSAHLPFTWKGLKISRRVRASFLGFG